MSLKGRKQFCFPESAIVSPITSHNKNEAKSIELHEKLNAIFSVSRSDKLSYPNNYGGAFIVDNDGGVVLVKEDLGQTKADLKKRLKLATIPIKNYWISMKSKVFCLIIVSSGKISTGLQ